MIIVPALFLLAPALQGTAPSPPNLDAIPDTPATVPGPCVDAMWTLESIPTFGAPVTSGSFPLGGAFGGAGVEIQCPDGEPEGEGAAFDGWPGEWRSGTSTLGDKVIKLNFVGGNAAQREYAWIQAATRPYTRLDSEINPPAGFTDNHSLVTDFATCSGANNRLDLNLSVAVSGSSLSGTAQAGTRGLTVGLGVSGSPDIGGVPQDRWFVGERANDTQRATTETATFDGTIYLEVVADGWFAALAFNFGEVSVTVDNSKHNYKMRWGAPGCGSQGECGGNTSDEEPRLSECCGGELEGCCDGESGGCCGGGLGGVCTGSLDGLSQGSDL